MLPPFSFLFIEKLRAAATVGCMIDRRLVFSLLAMSPAFIQRAFAARLPPPTQTELCDQIIAILKRRRPELMAAAEIGPCELRIDQRIVYLDNLAARIGQQLPGTWEPTILEYMDNLVAGSQAFIETDEGVQPFEAIRDRLYPQIVATEYIENEGSNSLWRPFSKRAAIAFVEDKGEFHRFLRADEAQGWKLEFSAIESVAISNLAAISESIAIELQREPGGVLCTVGVGDGLDAARLLVPAFRRRILQAAATPLQAAIPTRDTFMVWTPGIEPPAKIRRMVESFYQDGPYSRTDEIFELKAESVTPL